MKQDWDVVAIIGIVATAFCFLFTRCADSVVERDRPNDTAGAVACHAKGGTWMPATLRANGIPKMYACVDTDGRVVRLVEDK